MNNKDEIKREQILLSAKELFNTFGYEKTTLDDISHRVGMKKSSLYYYYKNKETLFYEAYSKEWEENLKNLEASASELKNPQDKILKYIGQSIKYYEQVVGKHNLSAKMLIETRKLFFNFFKEKVDDKIIAYLKVVLDDGVKDKFFIPCSTKKTAETILKICDLYKFDAFEHSLQLSSGKINFKKIEDDSLFAVQLILDGIKKR